MKKIITAFLLIIIGCAFYVNDYYHADTDAIGVLSYSHNIEELELNKNRRVFSSEDAKTGLIFYPGGKVESDAYIPLMKSLADQGIACVLVEMPFNLAVFDINAADGIISQFPEIENWYLAGHSLGGSMAASYIKNHLNEYQGLILLASYSTEDLSSTDLNILSIYGSEDKVLNLEKYEENKENLPSDFQEIIFDGGCHAYFGMYGHQKGDGTPTITNEQQIALTTFEITTFINKGDN